jgi:hypothetical protein
MKLQEDPMGSGGDGRLDLRDFRLNVKTAVVKEKAFAIELKFVRALTFDCDR